MDDEMPVELILEETDDGTEMGHTVYTTLDGRPVVVVNLDIWETIFSDVRDVLANWESGDLAGAVNMLRIDLGIDAEEAE